MRVGRGNATDALRSRTVVVVTMLLLDTAAGWLRPDGWVGECSHQQRSSEHHRSARAVPEDGGSRSSVHSPGAVHRVHGYMMLTKFLPQAFVIIRRGSCS